MENANKQVLQASEALEGPEAEIKKREAKMYHIKQAIDEAMKI